MDSRQDLSSVTDNFNHNSKRRLKIIAITGHVEPEYMKKAMKSGIDQVFPKPMPILQLGKILFDYNFIAEIPENLMVNKEK